MVVVVPHLEVASDQIGDPPRRPRLIGEAMMQGPLSQKGAQLLVLCGGEARNGAPRNGGLQATIALQSSFPGVDRVDGDTEVVRNLLTPMGAALDPFEGSQAAFFKLRAGVEGRLPTRHTASLSIQIFAVINKRRRGRADAWGGGR